ncbi:hypothetical protein CP533_2747 [Ophiocordyceps camponoti-saundersi (nom. inval.)]|nr:hypothetical protein CP533_2747 [Ophiocordyceps camponoti-saundersi (nom. inval.)]
MKTTVSNSNGSDGVDDSIITNGSVNGNLVRQQAVAKLMLDATALDRKQGRRLAECIIKLTGRHSSKTTTVSHELPSQHDDLLIELIPELCCFGTGMMLSNEAKQAAAPVLKPLLRAMSSVDEYYALDSSARLPASVQSITKRRDIGTREAKSMLAGIISELESEYTTQRNEYETTHGPLTKEVAQYMETVQLWYSGNFYWRACHARPCSTPEELIVTSKQGVISDQETSLLSSVEGSNSATLDADASFTCNGSTTSISNEEQVSDKDHDMDSFEKIVLAPFDYLHSLPSKGVRTKAIDALNVWYQVPDSSLAAIKSILDLLHSSSLMLDDIEDGSSLRRGKPATHILFGIPQTINSANYLFAITLSQLSNLSSRKAHSIFASELRNLHLGQGMDLHWTSQVHCPTEAEYMTMIDGKTGGLFRLLARLLQSESMIGSELDIENLATMLGRYFQIRDDFQNLCSADYTDQKGFCQDLDEGKFSLPLIHMLGRSQYSQLAWSMLHEGRRLGSIMYESKMLILDMMRESGSLEYTKAVLRKLEDVIETEVQKAEGVMETRNYMLRLLVESLKI